MNFKYRKFKASDKRTISPLMKKLYKEMSNEKISDKNINKTFAELSKSPEKGTILVLECEKQIIGYCLFINFWSNEFGGNMPSIDEFYIKPQFRNKGIGANFIKALIKNKFMKAMVFRLEVKPSNKGVIKLYKKIGFKISRNSHLIYDGKNNS